MPPRISVCIPAYNRPEHLIPLMDSILDQNFKDLEIVICEDGSPRRAQIQDIVLRFQAHYPEMIRYHENETNLGYDGNIRELFHRATGEYCLLLGNDDLLAKGALDKVASALDRYKNLGVILRSYATFEKSPDDLFQVHRYFGTERFFPAGADTAATFFRRVVVVSGLVIHRQCALKYTTDRFDGTLLYQVYLTANVLLDMDGVFLPDVLALYRLGATPDFGNSVVERDKFVPGRQTAESSLNFVNGYMEIAKFVDQARGVQIYKRILYDMGNYSYPILSIQARQQPFFRFLRYVYQLEQLGLWRNVPFQGYFLCLIIFGPRRMDRLIGWIKKRWGHTPTIGGVYRGNAAG